MMKIEEKEIADSMWTGRFHDWPRWGGMRGKETTWMALVECISLATWSVAGGKDMAWWRDVEMDKRIGKRMLILVDVCIKL
jgi:hypothetical protein